MVLAVAVGAVLALLPGLLWLETDNSPRIFFVEGSPGVEQYERFRELFGSDKVARLVVSGDGLWTAEGLSWLRTLEQAVAGVDGVQAVSGLYGRVARGPGGAPEWPPGNPEAFRRRAVSDPLNRDLGWVGKDGRVATVLAVLGPLDNEARAELLGELEAVLAGHPPPRGAGLSADLVGTPALDRALDASSREIGERFFPLLVILAVLLLAAVFRALRPVLPPLLFVGWVELVLLGALGATGTTLNLVLAVLPPLLFVIALATAVHVLVRYRDFRETMDDPVEAVVAAYKDKGWAVFWTGVSTFAGFTSLAVSRVGPVRSLGLWAGLGIALLTLAAFTILPSLLPLAGRTQDDDASRRFERFFQARGRRWAQWAAEHRRLVLGVAALLALVALAGLPRLTIETNALHYLPPDHPVRQNVEGLQHHGIGVIAVELLLTRKEQGFDDLDAFGTLAELTETLRQEPLVLGAVSLGDLLEDAVRSAPGGALFGRSTVRRMAFDRLVEERGEGSALGRFVAEEGATARVTVFTETVGYDRLEPLLRRMEATAREVFPQAEVVTTGEFPLVLESQKQLLTTLGWSLTLTLGVVGVIFRSLLPSTRLTLLALAPNLWPVVGVIGIMGWFGVPLDVATVMVASIVLGLAVDDTIHTLGHFRELAPKEGRFGAVAGALERLAPSYVLTGVILAAGFGVCALSDFAPTFRFGMLSAAAIALAVLGDLFLLPALLGSTPESVVERIE